jgi:hypothetical protein
MASRWSLSLVVLGRTFTFADQIDIDFSSEFSIFRGAMAEVSDASFTLDLLVDVAALVQQGFDLSAGVGTLSLDSAVVMVGRVINPVYGDPTEAQGIVRFTLRESVIDDTALIPDALAKVDLTTWPAHDPNVSERVYPDVFGAPGKEGATAGSPGYLVDTNATGTQYVLIAGHPVDAAVTTTATLHNVTRAEVTPLTIVNTKDGRQREVAVIDGQEGGGITIDTGDELWIEWSGGAAASGGGGDVLARYMGQSTLRQDVGRIASAIAPLNAYTLAGYIDTRVSPMEWGGSNLLPILPITIARDVGGMYPIVYRSSVKASDASAVLTVGPDCVAMSPITYTGEPITEFRLSYRNRADTNDSQLIATATEAENYYCQAARNRYRGDAHDGRYSEELQTDIVDATATAELIVAELVKRRALRQRSTSYRLDRTIWSTRINAGDVVTITDPDRSFVAQVCWVTSRTDDNLGMTIGVLIHEDPPRDTR